METKVRKKTSFLKGRTKEEFILELKKHVNGKAAHAYVFGSFLSPEFNADSDLDLLIVAETDLKFHERSSLSPELERFFLQNGITADLLVYTPGEFKSLKEEGQSSKVGFRKNFISSAKAL